MTSTDKSNPDAPTPEEVVPETPVVETEEVITDSSSESTSQEETGQEETGQEETCPKGTAEEETLQTEDRSETDAATEAAEATEEKKEEDFKDQYLRLRADFENFRKRTRKEKEDWTQRCLENICTDLLSILDHFDLGLENAKGQEISEDTLQGFELIRGQLGTTLGKYGLDPVEAESGTFDPNVHEAITHLASTEVPEGEIVAMTRKGYKLGTKLLRPAQVVVSAGEGEG